KSASPSTPLSRHMSPEWRRRRSRPSCRKPTTSAPIPGRSGTRSTSSSAPPEPPKSWLTSRGRRRCAPSHPPPQGGRCQPVAGTRSCHKPDRTPSPLWGRAGEGVRRASYGPPASHQPTEKPAHIRDQQFRRVGGGEMAAALHLRPLHDVVGALGKAAHGSEVVGERGYGRRHLVGQV